METSTKLTLLTCLLLILYTDLSLTSAQNFPSDPVFDTAGHELRRGNRYYILPANSTTGGGGLTLQLSKNGKCPYEIVQSLNRSSNGSPLRFTPINSDDVVRVNIDSNIEFVNFTGPKHCNQSNVWKLGDDNSTTPPLFVRTGGVVGNPAPQTVPNWFKILKYEEAYQIQFCPGPDPRFCPSNVLCRLLCGDIGIYVENGSTRRLAINQPIYKIVFKKA